MVDSNPSVQEKVEEKVEAPEAEIDEPMEEESKAEPMQPYDLSITPPEPKTPIETYHRALWQKAKGNEFFK